MREFYQQIAQEYDLESHRLKLLRLACECYDRAEAARLEIEKAGITFTDRYGSIKQNPACKIEADNKTLFARLLREMQLDIIDPDEIRVPRGC